MAKPTTRQEMIDYCLRKLGQPVINVDVAPEQCEDRVDEAFETYIERHFDATEEMWVSYPITQADKDNGYITIPEDILVISEIMPMSALASHSNMFGFQYQIAMQTLSPWRPFDALDYQMKVMNYEWLSDLVGGTPSFRFTRHGNRLRVAENFAVGTPLLVKVFKKIDPETTPSVWNDKWLKAYATALIKKQWGENTKKFGEIQLLGGVTINGQQLYDEALTEIEQLIQQLQEEYEEPTSFFVG